MNGLPAGRRTPRTFLDGKLPWVLISELQDGTEVMACYVIQEKRRATTKADKPYLDLRLGDRTGSIMGKVWDDVERLEPLCQAEQIVGVHARVGSWREELQLTVLRVEPLRPEPEDLRHFLPACPRDLELVQRALDALIGRVRDGALNALLRRCLGAETDLGRRFRIHPAATRNHHAYLGGLLEHTVSVAGLCERLADHYLAQEMEIDRELLVAGALLHDLGKTEELAAGHGFSYTAAGRFLGHIVLGIQIIAREAAAVPQLPEERLLLLQHLVASHQGRHEWASPTEPQTLEALILHYADDLDAKMNPAAALLAGVAPGEWTARDRHLGRSLYRPPSSPALEPVAPEEAVATMIDLFHG